MKKEFFAASLGAAALLMSSSVMAEDHQVQMLNKDSTGRTMQFEPAFIKIAPGDTITFVPTDKTHNSEALPGLIPENAEAWKGKINQEITVSFDEAGFYAYKCTPHLAMGMVGLVQVGEPMEDLDSAAVEKLPNKARERLTELVAEAESASEAP
ncbi:pseudoazurin [Devosia sp. YIM 151766]|uniref:pseudoazurin n=1 Tax=Devosia sp. YIM 151766 TaxID=3017325 RepID=UPI00255C7CCE|nr:pseudoazurin [Devosia sp. YIM 151766]WIY52233.1 pseudoazurin [Devosia sp. YIM 151766]